MQDPYRDWLGIPATHRPLDYYSLLGLPMFESQPQVIAAAADRQYARVMQLQSSPYAAWIPQLANELTTARNTLLSSAKLTYDEALRRALPPSAAQPPPVAPPQQPGFGLKVKSAIPPIKPEAKPAPPAEPTTEKPSAGISRRGKILLGTAAFASLLALGWIAWQLFVRPVPSEVASSDGSEAIVEESTPEMPAEVENEKPAATPPMRVVVEQEGTGEVRFTPPTAQLVGGVEVITQGTETVLGHWSSAEDRIAWDFRLVKPNIFRLQITYAAPDDWAESSYEVTVAGETKVHSTRSSGGKDKFVTDDFFLPIRKAGKHRLELRMVERRGEELLILQSVRLVPTQQRAK